VISRIESENEPRRLNQDFGGKSARPGNWGKPAVPTNRQ
jgi:hypothetical protein